MSYTGGNIQQVYAALQRLYELMNKIKAESKETHKEVTKNVESYRQLERVALRYLTIVNRLGLPEDIEQAVAVATTLLIILRQLQMTINIIQVGMGPIGWASFAASGALTVMSAASFGYDMMRGT